LSSNPNKGNIPIERIFLSDQSRIECILAQQTKVQFGLGSKLKKRGMKSKKTRNDKERKKKKKEQNKTK
jgi:hypothetical protein